MLEVPSRGFLACAAVCAWLYVGAQVAQFGINRLLLERADGFHAEVAQLVSAPSQLRQFLILAAMFGAPLMFGAAAFVRFTAAPAASLLGLLFGGLFVTAELFYRGLELFLVTRVWGVAYLAAPANEQALWAERIQVWNAAVGAWYFVLLGAHLLASCAFVIATWRPRHGWDRLLQAAFALNALRLFLRLLGQFGGLESLGAFNREFYFPATLLIFGSLALWTTREAWSVAGSR